MAEFSKLVITNKGQALLAKMIAGSGNIEFTKISTSSTAYTDAQLEGLASLSNVKQTSLISKVTRTNEVAIKVEAAFTNTELKAGYYMKACKPSEFCTANFIQHFQHSLCLFKIFLCNLIDLLNTLFHNHLILSMLAVAAA